MKKLCSISMVFVMLLSMLLSSSAMAINDNSSTIDTSKVENLITPAASKNNVIVIVPGIMGSNLRNGTKDVWAPTLTNTSMAPLECTQLGNSINAITPVDDDHYGATDAYKELYNKLVTEYSAVADIIFYPYDWRLSCSSAGSGLKSLVSGYSGQIILVAHSMGGLVSSEYLRLATAAMRNRTTLITLGTPFTGAPKALQIMETGDMGFGGFLGIADAIMTPQIKKYANNFPAVYELFPSSRSLLFLKVGATGSYLSYADSINLLKTLQWARKTDGTPKPMFLNSQTFMSGIDNNGAHYAYTAYRTYHIASNGYNTTNGVYYTKNSDGTYTYGNILYDNSGDGTVPLTSAWNRLANTDSRIFTYSNVGNHSDMVKNSTVLTKVVDLIKKTIIDTSAAMVASDGINITDSDDVPVVQNARGWIVNQGLDGRRININVNSINDHNLSMADGREIVIKNDVVFCRDESGSLTEIGNKWLTGIGTQYALLSGEYNLNISGGNDESQVIISYMENGYYDHYVEYNNLKSVSSVQIAISDYSEPTTSATTVVYSGTARSNYVVPVHIYSEQELQLINQD